MTSPVPGHHDTAYSQALASLYEHLRVRQVPVHLYNLRLDAAHPPRGLLTRLGSPHRSVPAIKIAGTKGKGSVSAMTASCLRAAGYRVGLYTSPHLQDFRERIRILTPSDEDGRISEEQFVEIYREAEPHLERVEDLTWFEIVTALAFVHFAREEVDVAVFEAGIGGRLDATNAAHALLSILTLVGFDHTDILGETLAEIALDKAGIFAPNVPAVTMDQSPEVLERLCELARERDIPLSIVGHDWRFANDRGALSIERSAAPDWMAEGTRLPIGLVGSHQVRNASVVVAGLSAVRERFAALDDNAMRNGLAHARWPGRLQTVVDRPDRAKLIVDCAHCGASAEALAQALRHEVDHARLWLVFSVCTDKDIPRMMRALFPLAHGIVLTSTPNPRSTAPAELLDKARAHGFDGVVVERVADALDHAWHHAEPGDLVCATGSMYLVGRVLDVCDERRARVEIEQS